MRSMALSLTSRARSIQAARISTRRRRISASTSGAAGTAARQFFSVFG